MIEQLQHSHARDVRGPPLVLLPHATPLLLYLPSACFASRAHGGFNGLGPNLVVVSAIVTDAFAAGSLP